MEDYSHEISSLDDQFRSEYTKREKCDDLIKHLTGELISAQSLTAALEGKFAALSEKAEIAERELTRALSKNKTLESAVNRFQVSSISISYKIPISR